MSQASLPVNAVTCPGTGCTYVFSAANASTPVLTTARILPDASANCTAAAKPRTSMLVAVAVNILRSTARVAVKALMALTLGVTRSFSPCSAVTALLTGSLILPMVSANRVAVPRICPPSATAA